MKHSAASVNENIRIMRLINYEHKFNYERC